MEEIISKQILLRLESDLCTGKFFDLVGSANLEFEEPEREIKMAELVYDNFLLTDKSKYDNICV